MSGRAEIQTQWTPETFSTTPSCGHISQGGQFTEESQSGVPDKALKQESEVLIPSQGSTTMQLCDLQEWI